MKKSDVAMLILVVAVSVMVSYFTVGSIPALKFSDKPVSVKTIEEYKADINEVNGDIFNKDAINPTVEVTIGNGD